MAGIIHALTLALLLVIAAPLAKTIPLAVLAAVLVVVAYNMGEWRHFRRLRSWPLSDAIIFLSTFLLTVAFDLVIAVQIGVVLSVILFIKQVTDTTQISPVRIEDPMESPRHLLAGLEIPPKVQMFRLLGPLLFGAADRLETAFGRTEYDPKIIILRMRKVTAIDATGLMALESLYGKMRARGQTLLISGLQGQPLEVMKKSGFLSSLGAENICPDTVSAVERAKLVLSVPEASGSSL